MVKRDMINGGQRILRRLPMIRKAIISHSEPLMWYDKKRMELELLTLKYVNRSAQCRDENGVVNESDPFMQGILSSIDEIERDVRQRKNWGESNLNVLNEIFELMLI
ncbi:hypothetical protein DPMN_038427 [Dreissena polymorpha]|uniref:Uncharacterized protein n=1 Tax=Dreissena polymorpha TaxID=45954 RepID=A0A9D4MFF6_DREPO|nr:hypothetical protein DPMN_038427 [Dreissena polymorpha]